MIFEARFCFLQCGPWFGGEQVAEERVAAGRSLVDAILKENRVVYGITTGFGKFARTVIAPEKLQELQENLIRSHSAGVGTPLPPERVRMLLALRINVLAKGHSGISPRTLAQVRRTVTMQKKQTKQIIIRANRKESHWLDPPT